VARRAAIVLTSRPACAASPRKTLHILSPDRHLLPMINSIGDILLFSSSSITNTAILATNAAIKHTLDVRRRALSAVTNAGRRSAGMTGG